ncbi:hypothetical protein F5X98DRAFT_382831 [Xylaria grammica]|nr:hypothetical protein F5X98DRAFT_382831 [Xylaria grammica]
MQFKAAAFSLFLTLATTQSIGDLASQIPPCPKKCLDNGAKEAGCNISDYTCQCVEADQVLESALQCVTDCDFGDIKKADELYVKICFDVLEQNPIISSVIDILTSAVGAALSSLTASATATATNNALASPYITTLATAATPSNAPASPNSATIAITTVIGNASTSPNTTTTAAGNATSAVNNGAAPGAALPSGAIAQAIIGIGMFGAAAIFALAM